MKLVVDTNVLISGSLWEGASAQILEAVACGKATLILSPELLAEFAEVIARPKFLARVAASGTDPTSLAMKLAESATIISAGQLRIPSGLRDPKDLPVLSCAVAAKADAIITGDQDLLVMSNFKNIPIVSVQEGLRLLEVA